MTNMSTWTQVEKTEYIPFLVGIVRDIPITDEAIERLSPKVQIAVRDLLHTNKGD